MEIETVFPNECALNERDAINSIVSWSIEHTTNLVTAIEVADKILANQTTLGLCKYTIAIEGKVIPTFVVSIRKGN